MPREVLATWNTVLATCFTWSRGLQLQAGCRERLSTRGAEQYAMGLTCVLAGCHGFLDNNNDCRKVEHLSEEAEALRQALDKFVGREQRREREAQERTELLRARRGGGGGEEDVITEVERNRRDLDSAKRSNLMLEQTLAQGLATLAHMAQNREMLKVS